MPEAPSEDTEPRSHRRQRAWLLVLAAVLFAGGASILLFLARIPILLRLTMGTVDVIAAAVIYVFVRQNLPRNPQ